MSNVLPEGAADGQSRPENGVGRGRHLRARAVILLTFAIGSGSFAAVTELVLHRWLHLYASEIVGAVWLFFGCYWSLAAFRQLQTVPPITVKPRRWLLRQFLEAYLATLPYAALRAFVVMAFVGVIERAWRA